MPTLNVRNVPDDLYARLQRRAQAHRRSLSAEVIVLLQWALDEAECTSETPLASIRRRRARQHHAPTTGSGSMNITQAVTSARRS